MLKLFNRTAALLMVIMAMVSLSCCSDDDNSDGEIDNRTYYQKHPGSQTIIVYIMGDNSLSTYLAADFNEMVSGSNSLPSSYRFVVFTDFGNNSRIHLLENGTDSVMYDFGQDIDATNPDTLTKVYQWIVDQFPSDEYSAIVAGHGTGALVYNDTTAASSTYTMHAIGTDKNSSETRMNINTYAQALRNVTTDDGNTLHFSMMFFDMCCMSNIETAYELRDVTDIIVAPASETPAEGADYDNIMANTNDDAEAFADYIVQSYGADGNMCIAAIKTDYLEDLCLATTNALSSISYEDQLTLGTGNCIYYFRKDGVPVLHDMRNVMLNNLSTEAYEQWLTYFNQAVFSKYYVSSWMTNYNVNINFYAFSVTDENFGGVSMIVPSINNNSIQPNPNTTMYNLQWANDVQWKSFGW